MTHTDQLLFGERLRRQRNSLGLTQEYVAERLDISLRYYQMLEQGNKGASIETLAKISKTLSVSMDYLLFGETTYPSSFLDAAMAKLTPEQQKDALDILALYIKACNAPK